MNRVKDGSRDSGRDPQGLDAKHESLTAKPERPTLVSKLTSLMPKVTKGPWRFDCGVNEYADLAAPILGTIRGAGKKPDGGEHIAVTVSDLRAAEANAELIALAPEIATAFLAQSTILEEAVSALEGFVAWRDRVQDGESGTNYLNGEEPPFGNGDDAWNDLDCLAHEARQTLTRIRTAQQEAK